MYTYRKTSDLERRLNWLICANAVSLISKHYVFYIKDSQRKTSDLERCLNWLICANAVFSASAVDAFVEEYYYATLSKNSTCIYIHVYVYMHNLY